MGRGSDIDLLAGAVFTTSTGSRSLKDGGVRCDKYAKHFISLSLCLRIVHVLNASADAFIYKTARYDSPSSACARLSIITIRMHHFFKFLLFALCALCLVEFSVVDASATYKEVTRVKARAVASPSHVRIPNYII